MVDEEAGERVSELPDEDMLSLSALEADVVGVCT